MSLCHGGIEKWGIRVLEKVVDAHLFSKQCFVAKKFKKMWYWAILAPLTGGQLVHMCNISF